MKENLAAHIHIHLLFSPGQESTWTLLERKFPKASEKDFNAAISLLEMDDVISVDPHPEFAQEMLVKIDYNHSIPPPPLPVPGFRFPGEHDCPHGTKNASTVAGSRASPADPFVLPTKKSVGLKPAAFNLDVSSQRRPLMISPDPSPPILGELISRTNSGIFAEGAWSHTPPRMRDALGEEEILIEGQVWRPENEETKGNETKRTFRGVGDGAAGWQAMLVA
ncbi:hypothetical protein [Phaffia rhodozyma]|uniref:Uncharacterized protein n=1 Tax=Phaffia rhodozyma TaxID=264483 RepID=A0A0F7SJJ2_PHARH|nr:hypothetical protein [Phaffia rhodozyma]